MKLATDIKNEIEKRGEISIQENCVTGEEFEKWLYEKDNEKHKDRNDIKVRFYGGNEVEFMRKIMVYDDTEKKLEDLAEELDISVAEIIDNLMEYEDEIRRNYGK